MPLSEVLYESPGIESFRSVKVVSFITRAIRIITAMTVVLFVISTLLLRFLASHSSNGAIKIFGREILIVTSGSMSPSFNTGDAVVLNSVNQTEAKTLNVGTIVTFRVDDVNESLITHRIFNINKSPDGSTTYSTKGDANSSPDATILLPSRIVGVVDFDIPRLGYVINALEQRKALLLFAAAAILGNLAVGLTPKDQCAKLTTQEKEN